MDDQNPDPTPRKLTKAECGRLGGLQTKARHGRAHYVRAGKIGFAAAARTHAAGNRKYNLDWLRARGKIQPPPTVTPEQAAALLRALQAQLLGTPEGPDHD